MAAHFHVWQQVTLADGAVARLCLCGSFRVQFPEELPRPTDAWSADILDLLQAEGTEEIHDESPA